MENLKAKSFDLRKDTVDIIVAGKGGHIGGDMSVIDTLMSLYFCQMNISPENMDDPNRDRFVLSKGHSVEAYYAVLAAKGFLDLEDIKAHFSKFGSKYIGHPNNKLPGIEMNSGSLGHGLPVCVGMALAGKKDNRDYRVYTVMGDGLPFTVFASSKAAFNWSISFPSFTSITCHPKERIRSWRSSCPITSSVFPEI